MTSNEIRGSFLGYFEKNGHARIAGSPVIPWGDPTLMFTNAGMNQFKDVFLGREKRDYTRATTCQPCIRAGGKHNDLDEVGHTTRHGTFLEMLGNFSFGDYFKEGAIGFAWEFLTKEMGLNPDLLYPSVYSTDEEAFAIWRDIIGVPAGRILRFGNIEKGDDENFWSMGTTGPCGPCSEIYIDRGAQYGPDDPYKALSIDAPRFLELWNLVFMQFNRNESGVMDPLPKPSIDTGLGLERMAMVLQGRENIFETDILGKLIRRIEEFTGKTYAESTGMPFRAAADHVRTLSFAIADGALPSNEGRGYVLRRILRRASRYLRKLEVHEPLIYRLVSDVVDLMGDAYPRLDERVDYTAMVIRSEEERFLKTLDQGVDLFEGLAADVRSHGVRVISGEDAFRLYDTFGFPVDLTRIMAEEQNLTVDMAAFEKAMEAQRIRARESSSFQAVDDSGEPWQEVPGTAGGGSVFVGYESDSAEANLVRYRENGDGAVELVFDKTPFYALSGGQVNDTGTIVPHDDAFGLRVKDVRDYPQAGRAHICEVERGKFAVSSLISAPARLSIAGGPRHDTERNHSATHLLQAGLQDVLGKHVRQSGSFVDPERLRFDFNHFSAVTADELARVEAFVNRAVIEDYPVVITQSTLEEARSMGAMSLFEEKYGDTVRVVKMGDVSLELCGGTHVSRTGRIGLFRIVSESSVAAGIRRIEAVTGMRSYELAASELGILQDINHRLNTTAGDVVERIESQAAKIRELEKEIRRLRTEGAFGGGSDIMSNIVEVGGVKVAFGRMDAASAEELKTFADTIRDRLGSGVGVLGAAINGKVSIVATVTDDLIKQRSLRAGDIVKKVAEAVGGTGGGRPHMAMAGGKDVGALDDALASVPGVIDGLLKGKA
ncbi:alanine--tRNA ligase [bacterium]|nr:alanine--tRNA ligase [bacterium]